MRVQYIVKTNLMIMILLLTTRSITASQNFHSNGIGYITTHSNLSLNGETDLFNFCSNPNSGKYYRGAFATIDNPKFVSVAEADWYIEDQYLILGIEVDGQLRGYPYNILNYHEVVNDFSSSTNVGVTYCPLTGTGLGFELAQLRNSKLGVTGFLFESNMVLYDLKTDSCYSQILSIGMSGENVGQSLSYTPTIETTWSTWKQVYPDSVVLSIDTGFSPIEPYYRDDYEEYAVSSSIYHQTSFEDEQPYNLYHTKEKVIILKSERQSYLFPNPELAKSPVSNHNLTGGNKVAIFYDEQYNLGVTFNSTLESGQTLHFELEADRSQFTLNQTYGLHIAKDQLGNTWNIRGEAIDGPNIGEKLKIYPNYYSYWFAAIIFFPSSIIFTPTESLQYDIIPENQGVFIPKENLNLDIFVVSVIATSIILVILIAKYTAKKEI